MPSEINLLKNGGDGSLHFAVKERRLTSLYFAIGFLILEILAYSGLTLFEKKIGRDTAAVEQQAVALDAQIGKIEKQRLEAISFQQRLKNLGTLLDRHLFWSRFLTELENYTFKGAVYDTLQIDEGTHQLILTGVIPSYAELGKLMAGLRLSPYILAVDLGSSGRSEGDVAGYTFEMQISVDPKIMKRK